MLRIATFVLGAIAVNVAINLPLYLILRQVGEARDERMIAEYNARKAAGLAA